MEPGGRHLERADVDRRTLLKRGAVLGAAVAWTAPTVQTLTSPAFAAGSPLCNTTVVVDDCELVYPESPECCECVEAAMAGGLSHPQALAQCAQQGACGQPPDVCGEQDHQPPPNPNPNPPSVAGEQGTSPKGGQVPVPTVIPAGE